MLRTVATSSTKENVLAALEVASFGDVFLMFIHVVKLCPWWFLSSRFPDVALQVMW